MAAGGDIYPSGTILGFRLMGLIIDEGTPLLRTLFNRMTPRGKSLQEHLGNHRDNLFELLNTDQQKIVYPSTGVANSSKDFDISLLCLLLERLGNTQRRDLIHELRKFKNKNHGHITGTALSKRKFDQLWKELSDILLRLGRLVLKTEAENRKLETRFLERKELPIDGELAKKYQEQFEDFHRQDNKVKDLVVAQGQKMCSLMQEGHRLTQKQTSKIDKIRKEWQRTERTHGKQHKQLFDKLDKVEKALKDAKRHQIDVVPQMVSTPPPPLTSLRMCICQQNTDSEGMPPTIEKLCKYLQRRYRKELRKIRPLPWCEDLYLDLEHMFTTLQMVGWDGIKEDSIVEIQNMFQSYKAIVPETIRVEGNPGIGKTTLCYKIVYDCSANKFGIHNKFASFRLVLYVEMRQVPHDATDLKSTIFKQVFREAYYKHEAEFWDYVKCNPEDVLFVLDGLDEMPEETRQKLEIVNFIRGQIIPDIHIIVTSRPYLCNRQLTSCDRHFVIKGYSQENIKSYIDKHPKLDSNSKEGMLKQLKENENLHQLSENPLNLALLCMLWKDDWNNADLPQTLTGLYSLLVLAIVKRYAKKCLRSAVSELTLDEMPEPMQGNLNQLSHLAWDGIKEDCLNFSGETVESLVEIGFLTKDLNLTTAIQQPFWFKFLHKTFQEYFAARHLHSLCMTQSSQASNILNECVQNDRYQQVLKFLAGFLGINARCLFKAFRDYLSTNQEDDRTVSLCLECLHECGAGTELARYVSDVLPRDWKLSSYGNVLQWIAFPDTISHFHPLRNMYLYLEEPNALPGWPCLPSDCFGMYFFTCYTNRSSVTDGMLEKGHYIITNEALYGLVCLLHYLAKTNTDNNTLLSNVQLQPGVENAACRFLNAISDIKGIRLLAITMADHHDSKSTEIIYRSSKNDSLPIPCTKCKLSLYPCKYSTLNHMDNVLSLVQTQTQLSLATCSSVKLDANFNVNSTDRSTLFRVINTIIRLGTEGGRDRVARVGLHIDCTAEMYIPEFVSFSIENLVTAIKHCQTQSSCPQGRLELRVIVKNLPLAEKPMVQSHLAELLPILQHSHCIISRMIFECVCEDDSVVSTIPLLESLTLNQSLTEVSFLCDDPENVVRCLRDIFAENRTLQKLEIGFLHPVEDETMAKIFRSYPIDNQCQITSFSVLMETGLTPPQTQTAVTKSCNNNHLSYEQTVNAILNICKNLCDGSTLQQISFRTGPGYAMTKTGCPLNCVLKVTPFCPGSLFEPLIAAIMDSRLIVNLAGITWLNSGDLKVTDNFFNSLAGMSKSKLERLQQLHSIASIMADQLQRLQRL